MNSRNAPVATSAALIVRNEENYLATCLDTVAPVVDEIVVVDTGSEDASVDIARSYGARILHSPWTGDFAAARNVALDAVRGEWVLYIDADETVRVPPGTRLADLVHPAAPACFVSFQPRSGFTRYRELRCFKSDPLIRFRGEIHETVIPSLRDMGVELINMPRAGIEIDHAGYDVPSTAKLERNLGLLRQAVRRNPERLYYWYDLALTLNGLGSIDEAREVASQGLARTSDSSPQRLGAASLLRQFLSVGLLESNAEAARRIAAEGLVLLPDDYTLRLIHGQALFALGRFGTACDEAQSLLRVDPDQLRYELLAHDRRVFTEHARHLMGSCLLALGRLSEAARHFLPKDERP